MNRTNRTPLVGREQELAVLTGLVERSARGGAPLVFVHGEAGIGKTALVRALVAEARDVTVLAAAGEETETALSLGVVGQLLDRARSRAHRADPPPTAFAAGAALVAAVSDLEVERPVLRSFDDPAVAPGFLRLHRDPRATDLALHGLDAAAVGALAQQHGVDLPVGTARRLAEHTSGNPLWSTALLRELSPEQLSSLPPELPAPGELRAVVVALLDRASTGARRLVEASAVAGADWPLGLLARAGSVTAPATALAEAVGAGLVTEVPGPPPHVRPAHALVRAAVLSSVTTGRRLDLHARLAELAPDARQRLRHEIAASPGADDALSARAAAAAAEAGTRGDLVGATELLEAAARLGTDPERDGRLLDEAAATGLMSGDVHRARALVGALADLEPTPRRLLLRAWLALNEGQHPEAEARLRVALERAASSDDRTVLPEASRLMAHVLLLGGREAEAVGHARRA